ncbi:MAG: sensor domain-containing diguanylate cyclase [Myxococcota bacterium]
MTEDDESALSGAQLHPFLRRARRQAGDLPDLGRWLGHTLGLARELVPAAAGAILLDDPALKQRDEASTLTFVAAFGAAHARVLGQVVPPGRGIAGRVYRQGRPLRVDLAGADPARLDFFPEVDARSAFETATVLAVPIRLEEQVCGVLELLNRLPSPGPGSAPGARTQRGEGGSHGAFGARDLQLATLVADHVGRAILNAVDLLKENDLAQRDALTGLANVRGLESFLHAEVRSAEAERRPLAVLFFDVDHLKRLNDRLGHQAGSEVLRRVGHALARVTREEPARAYRFGGDEFVVVYRGPEARAVALAEQAQEEVRQHTAGPFPGGTLPAVELSVGVATLATLRSSPRDVTLGDRLLGAADRALYRAKRAGRGRVARPQAEDDTLGS